MVQIKHDAFMGPLDQTLKAPTSGHNKDVDMFLFTSVLL